MTVIVRGFELGTGVTVWDDALDHGGVLDYTDIQFGQTVDGKADPRFLRVGCPFAGCDNVSIYPMTGGAYPVKVRRLFARLIIRRAAALGIPAGQRTWPALRTRMKTFIATMEPGAPVGWIDAMSTADDDTDDDVAVGPIVRLLQAQRQA